MSTVAFPLAATDKGGSGLGRWAREVLPRLARTLEARGDSLLVLATPDERDAYRDVLRSTRVALLPARVELPAASALYALFALGAHARSLGADVLLMPAGNRRTPLLSPIPTISVVHDLATARSSSRHGALRHGFVRHAITRALATSSAIVTVSSSTADEVATLLDHRAPPLYVARNGVDTDRFRPRDASDPQVIDAKRALGLAEPFVLYPSRLEAPAKNHRRLLDAWARTRAAKSHRLVFVGPDWGAERSLRAHCRSLGLDARVLFAGVVSDRTLEGLVAGAALATIVGTAEGFGLPALEALASGTRLLAARAGALPEVSSPLGVLVDPFDVAAMSEAIDRCLDDDALARRVRVDGPRFARAFSWDRVAETLATLVTKLSPVPASATPSRSVHHGIA